MSDLWGDVRDELSAMSEHYAAGSLSPTGVDVRVPSGTVAAGLVEQLTGGRSAWVHLTCPGRKGERSHETGERVKLQRSGDGCEVVVAQPTRITAEETVSRWALDCPVCGRREMWRNPTDLVHDVVRALAEWSTRAPEDRGRCRLAWVRN